MALGRVFRYTTRLTERKIPDSFIHLRNAYYFGETGEQVIGELRRIKDAGFDNVQLIHGNAWKLKKGLALVLSAPRGSGKSTLSLHLEKAGVPLFDDGILITAEKEGKPYVLSSGLQEFRKEYDAYKGKMRAPFSRFFSSGQPNRAVRWFDFQTSKLSAVLAAFKMPSAGLSPKMDALPISRVVLFNDRLHTVRPKRADFETGALKEITASEIGRAHEIRTKRSRHIKLADIAHFLK